MLQTRSYDDASTFAQASAAIAATRRTAAPPVSVRRNSRSGVWMLRAQAVRPEKRPGARPSAVSDLAGYGDTSGRSTGPS